MASTVVTTMVIAKRATTGTTVPNTVKLIPKSDLDGSSGSEYVHEQTRTIATETVFIHWISLLLQFHIMHSSHLTCCSCLNWVDVTRLIASYHVARDDRDVEHCVTLNWGHVKRCRVFHCGIVDLVHEYQTIVTIYKKLQHNIYCSGSGSHLTSDLHIETASDLVLIVVITVRQFGKPVQCMAITSNCKSMSQSIWSKVYRYLWM